MSRLIDADALKIPNTYTDAFENCRNCKLLDQDQVREIINNAPTIDAVSVVRCKECKYKRINEDDETRYYYCALEVRPNRQWSVDDTDYCSWGEVRDE